MDQQSAAGSNFKEVKSSIGAIVNQIIDRKPLTLTEQALSKISPEINKQTTINDLAAISAECHSALSNPLSSIETIRATASALFRIANTMAFEMRDLQRRFDRLMLQYVRRMFNETQASLRPYGDEGVDNKMNDLRMMCAQLDIDHDALWAGRLKKWEVKQALTEARMRGVVDDHMYGVWSRLIDQATKEE